MVNVTLFVESTVTSSIVTVEEGELRDESTPMVVFFIVSFQSFPLLNALWERRNETSISDQLPKRSQRIQAVNFAVECLSMSTFSSIPVR